MEHMSNFCSLKPAQSAVFVWNSRPRNLISVIKTDRLPEKLLSVFIVNNDSKMPATN